MFIKNIYSLLLKVVTYLFGVDFSKKFDSYLRFGRKMNLKKPTRLDEKVAYLELHNQTKLKSYCTDKFTAKLYVESKGLKNILIPNLGGPWLDFEEIDFDELPNSFVLKATHGCKMNYVVKDKKEINLSKLNKKINSWLNTVYGSYSVEPHYEKIPHRIIAEKYINNIDDLVDYKIHCFNGKPKFILTCSNRNVDSLGKVNVDLNLYDVKWNRINGLISYKNEKVGLCDVKKPVSLDSMIKISEELSKDFKFVRVDLYEINGEVRFGELTFSPGCCVFPYFTIDFLKEAGSYLEIGANE